MELQKFYDISEKYINVAIIYVIIISGVYHEKFHPHFHIAFNVFGFH